jgi:hypothetical protein
MAPAAGLVVPPYNEIQTWEARIRVPAEAVLLPFSNEIVYVAASTLKAPALSLIVDRVGASIQSLTITGSAAGLVNPPNIGASSRSLAITGTASGTIRVAGASSQALAITGTATGTNSTPLTLIVHCPLDGDATNIAAGSSITTSAVGITFETTDFKKGTGCGVFGNSPSSHFKIGPEDTTGGPMDLSTGDFTIEGYVKTATTSGEAGRIFSQQNTSVNGTILIGFFFGQLEFRLYNNTPSVIASVVHNVSANTWYHFAAVIDGTTARLFLDGTGASTTLSGTRGSPPTNGTWIGRFWSTGEYLSGRLDDPKIHKFAKYTSNFTPEVEGRSTQAYAITRTSTGTVT